MVQALVTVPACSQSVKKDVDNAAEFEHKSMFKAPLSKLLVMNHRSKVPIYPAAFLESTLTNMPLAKKC